MRTRSRRSIGGRILARVQRAVLGALMTLTVTILERRIRTALKRRP
jgi:hypothetical protein